MKSTPTLLVYRGQVQDRALRQRVSRAEVSAAVRSAGIARLAAVGAVVLETDAYASA